MLPDDPRPPPAPFPPAYRSQVHALAGPSRFLSAELHHFLGLLDVVGQ
jgi:hypothetical protein